jgi:CRP/FNR family transcriptional regulator
MKAPAQRWQDTVDARVSALAAVVYLGGLGAADLRELAREARFLRFGKGEYVFQEGEPCSDLHVIASGRVKLSKLSPEGREQVLHTERAGALGKGPLFDGGPYPVSALAMEPSALLFLPKSGVMAWCRKRPEVAIGIARVLARRVRRFAALAEELALREVSQRLTGYLDRLTASEGRKVEGGIEVVLTESNQEIAAQIGTVRELVSRMLGALRREGLIRVSGRRITILNPQRLRGRARPGPD